MIRVSTLHRPALLLLLVIVTFGGALRAGLAALPAAPEGFAAGDNLIVRIYYDSIHDIERLHAYDVWEYNNLEEGYVLAAVDAYGYRTLRDEGWRVTAEPDARRFLPTAAAAGTGFYGDYRTVDQLYADLEALEERFPQLSALVQYGESYCLTRGGCTTPGGDEHPGFPLLVMRVTNEAIPGSSTIDNGAITPGEKPIFFLMANIHAREITTPEIAMRFLAHLLEGHGVNADATWIVDHHEVWIVPTANPDGHWLVELGAQEAHGGVPFSQRKNANNDADEDGEADCDIWPPGVSAFEQYGIDLNRNHSFGWGLVGASDEPCSMTYHGPSAASEVEVAQLEELVVALFPDQRDPDLHAPAPADTTGILITLHSFSNLVLWPWGNSDSPAPNYEDLKSIGDRLALLNGYHSCQPNTCLYLTSGSTDDWAYGELGIPALTFEIGNQFMPPYYEIDANQWPANRPALMMAAKLARTPYMTTHGPDVVNLKVTADSGRHTISALAGDAAGGNDLMARVVYSIDVPPWQTGAQLHDLDPADGIWDSTSEMVLGAIDPTGLAPGRHILYLQGRDTQGYWGVISAVFFEIRTGWAFDKWAVAELVAPGDTIPYIVDLTVNHPGGGHDYTLVISDTLPADLAILPESIRVDGLPRPDIYDATTQTLRFEQSGTLVEQLSVRLNYSAVVSKTVTTSQTVSNVAAAAITIDGARVDIPAVAAPALVSGSIDRAYVPVAIAP